jgi:translation initiation factor IF-3
VIDAEGEMRGVMTVREALALAEEAGLDLVEISPAAEPPVCKVLDCG